MPAVLLAAGAASAVLAIWAVFVRTATGRLVDEAAWEGALTGQNRLWQLAGPVLDVISGPFIIGVLLATMLLAVLRRRVLLAVQVAIVMGGANLTTQVLKHVLLDRPDLGLGDPVRNTLPSGHTTAAASVAVALVLVVPRRLRPTAAVLGAAYTAATGVSTLVGRWHRPSDVAAAVLVVLAWAAVAHAIAVRAAVVPAQRSRQTAVVGGLLGIGALSTGAVAALALQRSVAALEGPAGGGLTSRAELLTAYGGGALGVVAFSCAAFALLLALLRSGDAGPV
ncbi:MAG: hypothetical protein JWP95_1982 [Actinotalea sp.]|nr:hypothetical protein [Actinotalea sp.]